MHELTLAKVHQQQLVEVQGQSDVLVLGVPYLGPYNVNSSMNPILATCMGLGYYFNSYRGQAGRATGGAVILYHPLNEGFNQLHHPSYVDFYEEVLAESTDPAVVGQKYEAAVRRGPVVHPPLPDLARLPRRPPVLHVVLGGARDGPRRRRDLGRRRPQGRRRGMGFRAASHARRTRSRWRPAPSAPSPSITYLHNPPHLIADVTMTLDPSRFEQGPRMSSLRGGVDDVRQVARGWRWGRRSQVPRSAEPWVPEAKSTVFRVRLGAPQAGDRGPRGGAEGRPRAAVPLAGAHQGARASTCSTGSTDRSSSRPTTPPTSTPRWCCSRCPTSGGARTAVAAAADYFFDTWWRAVGSSVLFNTFPIDRRGGTMAATPGEVLADGWSLLIFPEGTRSQDGWMGNFRMGAAFLANEHGVPVVPVAHRGTFAAMPRGQNWPAPGRRQLTIRFGEPLIRPGRTSRCATSRRGSRTRSPPCSTRTARPGGRPGSGSAAGAVRPTRPGPRSPSGAGSGSRPSRPVADATGAALAAWRSALTR